MSDPSSTTLIRNRRRQQSLFRELIRNRALLTMTGTPRRLQGVTQLLDTAPESGKLALEAPNNEALVQQLVPGMPLRVRGSLRGVPVYFEVILERLAQDEDLQALVCEWPEEVDYRQRRGAFRMSIPLSMAAQVTWAQRNEETGEESLHEGRPVDLSIQGMGLDWEPDEQPAPVTGGAVVIQSLVIGPHRWRDIDAVLRNCQRHTGRDDLYRVGLEFGFLSPSAERMLNRFIMDLQCEAAKRT
ncbi:MULTISPECIES: flagellar brake protein [unclassified Ectothiorhodospira]|uniref:flagellar brake protein n=1 Tax=unclassified Ectothiorhodospira TaxID=2684909 RepID=UPI001EE8D4DA|nr:MULTISPECIES: flagellar brake protein [unclassified Ectothiorhodospira]MCG5516734.1 flagellar brake protein [Ectothiorhodospira sp. 9100]MCG5519422.1 flagellar brake protein [Ectothiorhodospira sp. 9905]